MKKLMNNCIIEHACLIQIETLHSALSTNMSVAFVSRPSSTAPASDQDMIWVWVEDFMKGSAAIQL